MKLTRFSIAGLMGLVLVIALGLVGLKEANAIWASVFFTVTLIALVLGILTAVQGRGRTRAFWTGFAISGWIYLACAVYFGPNSGVPGPQLLTELLLTQMEQFIHPQTNTVMTLSVPMYAPSPIALPASIGPPAPVVPSPPVAPTPTEPLEPIAPAETPLLPPAPPAPIAPPGTVVVAPAPPATTSVLPTATNRLPPSPLPVYNAFMGSPFEDSSYRQVGHSLATLLAGYVGGLYSLFVAARRDRRQDESVPTVSPSSP